MRDVERDMELYREVVLYLFLFVRGYKTSALKEGCLKWERLPCRI